MKIIDRYLFRELVPPFVTGMGAFTLVLITSQLLRLTELIVNKGVGVGSALKLVAYLLPSVMVMTVPMSVLLAALTAFGRLSADNEITSLKSGGWSLFRLSVPALLFALLAWLFNFWLITEALPRGNQAFRGLMFDIIRGKAAIGLKERVFNDDFDGLIIYVNSIPQDPAQPMRGILIHDYRGEMEKPRREPLSIVAREGRLVPDPANRDVVFRLGAGSIHSLSRDKERYEQINFSRHDLRLTMVPELAGGTLPKGLREMTIPELQARKADYARQGLPTGGPLVELHKKFAIPFACLIFAVLGLSLGVVFRRGEKMVAFALCVGVVLVYYVFLVAGEPLGKQGVLPPWLSMWGANIFFAVLTAVLFVSTNYEKVPAAGLLGWFRARQRG